MVAPDAEGTVRKEVAMQTVFIKRLGIFLLIAGLCTTGLFAAGGARSTTPTTPSEPEKTPEEEAIDYYNQGIAARDRAWKLEEKAAAEESEAKAAKMRKKVGKSYKAAAGNFERAVRRNPQMFQAFSSLGYALRKTGDYTAALEAYNTALELEPKYTEAIEYRAEAYLGLNRIDDAKQAFEQLMDMNRQHALELLEAMQKWVAEKSTDPGELGAQAVKEFELWIQDRAERSQDMIGHSMPGQNKKDW